MKTLKTIITLILVASFAWGQLPVELMKKKQFDYYVDSVNGSDANSGRAQGAAWKTIAKWTEHAQRVGEKTCLVRGSHWREQMTVTANNVTVAACGAGERPLLDASDVIAAGAWSKTGGYTNVYQATVATYNAGSTGFVGAWENGTRMVRVATLALCDSTVNSMAVSSDSANGNITLYIHASDNSDPSSSGKSYDFSARNTGFYAAVSGVRLTGINTRRNLAVDGSLVVGSDAVIRDAVAYDGSKHSIFVGEGSVLENVEANQAYYTSAFTMFVYYTDTPTGKPVTFRNCKVIRSSWSGVGIGFYGHRGPSGSFGTVTYDNCSYERCYIGIQGGPTDSLLVVKDSSAGATVSTGVYVQAPTQIFGGSPGNIDVAGSGYTLTVRGATIGPPVNAFQSLITGGGSSVIIDVQNSTVVGGGISGNGTAILWNNANAPNIISRGNIFTAIQRYIQLPAAYTLDSDYNTFPSAYSSATRAVINSINKTLAEFRSATGQDAHSTPAP